MRIGDVAKVVQDHQPLVGDAVINDGPGPDARRREAAVGQHARRDRGRREGDGGDAPGLPGIEIDTTIFRPATFVEEAIDNLTDVAGARRACSSCSCSSLFLLDWRAALISVVTIPLSLRGRDPRAARAGATINTMVLAGFVIALGAIVDDAIVDVENIVRRLRQRRPRRQHRSRRRRSSSRPRSRCAAPIVYASLIEVVALLPIFFLQGLTGAFFKPLAFAYALAVLVSLVVALIRTPALSLILLREAPLERRESPLVARLQRGYERVLAPDRPHGRRPRTRAVGALAARRHRGRAAAGPVAVPEFKERDFLMHWVTKPGHLAARRRRASSSPGSKELRAIPGVRNFGSHIGQALLGEEVAGVDFGENWISIDPTADYDETLAAIEEVVDGYPGLFRDVADLPQGAHQRGAHRRERADRRAHLRAGPRGPAGEGRRGQRRCSAGVDGIVDEHVELQTDVPQIEVEVDLAKAAAVRHQAGRRRAGPRRP